MKTIGLIGGTSWVSTIDYYRLINLLTNEKLGGSNAARIILYSLNFQEFKNMLDANDWKSMLLLYTDIAIKLQNAGADCIVIGANTPHFIAEDLQEVIPLPLLHIAEETAKAIKVENITKVALLGTKFVMDERFYKDKLSLYGIETIIPAADRREFIHNSIFNELTKGIFTDETKETYLEIIEELTAEGAEGIIYACTEIPILLQHKTIKARVFDTTLIHAKAAVAFATAYSNEKEPV